MTPLPTRPLGRSDMAITPVGIGTAPLSSTPDWWVYWGRQSEAESIAAIQAALDLGINWIDTAPFYGWGRGEEIVGRAVRGRREQVFLFTKCGSMPDGQGRSTEDLRPDNIRQEVENSLRRLQVERIDLLQFHDPDPNTPIEESWAVVQALIAEGKLRCAGLSNHPAALVERALQVGPVASLQHQYNLLRRGVEADILPLAGREELGFLAWSPLASGFLLDSFELDRLDAADFRRRHPFGTEPLARPRRAAVERLAAIARRRGRTMADLAVAWILRRPEVTGAIVGIRSPEEARQMTGGLAWTLTPDELEEIDAALAGWEAALAAAGRS